jgi:iron(III) transport system substrate-binding protein
MGEDGAWKFMDSIHQNMERYTHSGSKPCPLDLVVPAEGVGWEVEASGILKTSKKIEAAKKLMDWHISPAAMKVYNEYLPILAIPEIAAPVAHFPTDTVGKMIVYTSAAVRILYGLATRGLATRTQVWRTR